ncbi:invasion associated locus B family protein [Paracoccus sp. Z330]|uniref:Invasion associated locus B family protein n=1 Tax=Paracoccus onchidii TaxID=3017813 RepID=A0ABT4ZEZ5_9RHOB|nr:invasion associated locus B family protein [Paracoccus onchidii]MDB6177903.1 invasion associated locus B family protein [Paracoccus onchidii]
MPIKPSQTLLAALALVAAPAFAQDSTPEASDETSAPAEQAATEAEQPAEAPAAEAPAADETTATDETPTAEGEAAAESDEPQVGSYYVKSTHTDWTLRCIRAAQGEDPCELYQLLQDGEGNSVAEMTLIPLKNGNVAAGATIVAPLETDLIKGLGFSIDSSKTQEYPFSFCAPVGCVARVGFTAGELTALKGGNVANLSLMPFGGNPENPVKLELSLSGFTAAFNELSEYSDQASAAAN